MVAVSQAPVEAMYVLTTRHLTLPRSLHAHTTQAVPALHFWDAVQANDQAGSQCSCRHSSADCRSQCCSAQAVLTLVCQNAAATQASSYRHADWRRSGIVGDYKT